MRWPASLPPAGSRFPAGGSRPPHIARQLRHACRGPSSAIPPSCGYRWEDGLSQPINAQGLRRPPGKQAAQERELAAGQGTIATSGNSRVFGRASRSRCRSSMRNRLVACRSPQPRRRRRRRRPSRSPPASQQPRWGQSPRTCRADATLSQHEPPISCVAEKHARVALILALHRSRVLLNVVAQGRRRIP